jgi:hypothetical protein
MAISTSEPVTTTYAEYYLPGIFVSETSRVPVTGRDPQQAAREAPPSAFAFRFCDVVTGTLGGTGVSSGPVNASGRYYIDAEALTIAGVEALPGDHRILLDNMRINGWDQVVLCRTGNFQPLEPGDTIVFSQG